VSNIRTQLRCVVLVLVLHAVGACSETTSDAVKDSGAQSIGGAAVEASGGAALSNANSVVSSSTDDWGVTTGKGGASNSSLRSSKSATTASTQSGGSSASEPASSGGSSRRTTSTSGSTSTGAESGQPSSGATGGANTTGDTTAKGLTLYYIRHGEVVANTLEASEITYENSDQLTELGVRQIAALTTYLQGLGDVPDAVLVSPFKRTQNTIAPFLKAESINGEIWMELAECCTQTPSGAALPTAPTYAKYLKPTIESDNLSFRAPDANLFWQNDSYEQGLFMVMTAKAEILSRYSQSGKTIFVIGHASAGQLMIGLLRGEDVTNGPTTGRNAVYLYNTGVTKLSQDPVTGLFKLDGMNMNKPQTK
jgi:broad specificity phosphatase PhoE